MTILDFTVEEINLIAIYKTESRVKTVARINQAFPYMDEDMQENAITASRRISKMTEAEFSLARFIPADDRS